MELGFTTMNTPEELHPADLARALEERGFTSLWTGEHSHIPVARTTPYPAGGELPDPYRRMMDPFLSLLLAVDATTALRVGTSVALPLEHDLFGLAKSVATIDRLSGGRFDFGVGVGWNEEELADHRPDISWASRYRALEECIAALKVLWRDDEAEHHGRWFDFDAVWSEPKPVQVPHPPIVVGMAGRLGTAHAVTWGDAWMPMDLALGNVAKRIERFRQAVAEADRAPMPIIVMTWGDPTRDTLAGYRDLGIDRVVIGAAREGWEDAHRTMPFLDRYAELVPELSG